MLKETWFSSYDEFEQNSQRCHRHFTKLLCWNLIEYFWEARIKFCNEVVEVRIMAEVFNKISRNIWFQKKSSIERKLWANLTSSDNLIQS